MEISFSVETGEISRGDVDVTSKITEEYFGMEKDPEQMPATKETRDWIFEHSECLNIIRDGKEIVGYAFVIPSNIELMEKFVSGKISENEMFEEIKKLHFYDDVNAIYLAASFLKEKYRGKGLALKAKVGVITRLMPRIEKKPVLYFWGYSEKGGKLCYSTARELGLEIFERKD